MLISQISGFLEEFLLPFIPDTKHKLYSFAGCQGLDGVIDTGSHISYTRPLEEQTFMHSSISQPNLSMVLV